MLRVRPIILFKCEDTCNATDTLGIAFLQLNLVVMLKLSLLNEGKVTFFMYNLNAQVYVISHILRDVLIKMITKAISFYFEETDSFLRGNIYE